MDNQNQKKLSPVNTNLETSSPKSITVSNYSYDFLSKRFERMSSAIHLVTNLFSVDEPLKLSLRKAILELQISSFEDRLKLFSTDKESQFYEKILINLGVLISLIKVAKVSGLISSMNSEIILRELKDIESIVINLTNYKNGIGYTLAEDFFVSKDSFDNETELNFDGNDKGQSIGHYYGSQQVSVRKENSKVVIKDSTSNKKDKEINTHLNDKKNGRRDVIISLLRKDSRLTIKDFAGGLKDVSEKTIQRELLAMVASGVLKKEGERRWSTYSLA
jgi:hypothetical protein